MANALCAARWRSRSHSWQTTWSAIAISSCISVGDHIHHELDMLPPSPNPNSQWHQRTPPLLPRSRLHCGCFAGGASTAVRSRSATCACIRQAHLQTFLAIRHHTNTANYISVAAPACVAAASRASSSLLASTHRTIDSPVITPTTHIHIHMCACMYTLTLNIHHPHTSPRTAPCHTHRNPKGETQC